MPESLDEEKFRRWLENNDEIDPGSIDALIARTRRALGMVDIHRATTDEHVYIALFGNRVFDTLGLSARSQLKRAAILFHHFRLSGGA